MKMLSPFPSGKTIIHITGKGCNTEVINSVEFVVSPYEDVYNQGIIAGFVKVPKSEFKPGAYEKASSVTQVESSNTLVILKEAASFVRNRGT